MEVLNKDHGADDASVVSGSTNMTDVTQNLQVPDLGRHPDCYKMPEENSNMSLQTDDGVSNTANSKEPGQTARMCRLAWLYAGGKALKKFTQNWQKSPSVDGTASEMSQPLIPVISKNSSTLEGKKACLELQMSVQPQPLVGAPYYKLSLAHDLINSQSVEASQSLLPQIPMEVSMTENNRESADLAKHLSQPLKRASCREGPSGQSQGAVTLSQSEVGMSQSQGAVTLTQREKDPVDRIISRLDRLVSSLDKVPRRQMMVMEATVLQCITSLQDSLNNKLKKRASVPDTTGIVRRVLHTTQNGLLKLTELHKLEKSQLTQTGIQSTHTVAQSNVNDLAKRQRRVFDLLKRQKYLVEYYKTGKRPIPDNSIKEVTSSQHSGAATSKDYNRGKHRDIRIKHSQNLGRTRKGRNLEPKMPTVANETKVNTYKSSTGKRMEKSVKGISKSEINREVNMCPFASEKAPSRDIKRITTEADKLDTDNSGGECENAVISQDVTTIPDTQELGYTQESGRVSIQDTFGDREDSTIDVAGENDFPVDDADAKETEEEMTVKKAEGKTAVETNANDYCSKHKDESNTNMEMEISNERGDSKQERGETVDRYEAVKKARLDGEIINAESGKSTKNAKDHTELTEVLWLNMLREDTKVKCSQGKATTKGQELLTATKLNEEPGSSIEPDAGVCRSEFPFAKPNILRQLDADKYTALPEVPKQGETSFSSRAENANLSKKTNIVSDTEFKGKQSEKIDRQEINIGNQKNNQVIQGLSSPPAAIYRAETWHNVSPTATSMSSDVFVVKMKDLERRMRNRTMLSNKTQENKQSNSNERAYVQQVRNPGNDEVMEDMNRDDKDFGNDCGEKVKVSDTISDCIASVIKQSRNFATRKDGASRLGKVFENSARINPPCQETNQLNIPEKRCDVWTKPLLPAAQPKSLSVNDRGSSQKVCTQGSNARLPTLRDLVHSGQITHGKGVLSCFLKGKTRRASLTPLGKIRTEEGLVFTTVSQWVSTLTDGAPVKKRKAYEMVLYKGRQLLSFCRATLVAPSSHIKPVTIVKVVQPSGSITSADQSTQVNDAEITQQSKKMTDVEKRLNSLLSSCVVRLLTEHDFVSCDDLPENFWSDDFSKVRLHKDIWDNVDAW